MPGFSASRPPTSESTADPSGAGQAGELRFVVDATSGELTAIWRNDGTSWVKKVDTTAPIITTAQMPSRPSAGGLSENTLYVHTDNGEVDIVSGGTWVENIGRAGIAFGPPANMPVPSTVNLGTLFYVSEQGTVGTPVGLYAQIGGAWVGVSTAGAPQTKLIALDLNGTLSVNQASRAFRPPTGGSIVSVHADVNDAATDSSTGQPLTFDLEVAGTTVFTDATLRPTVPQDTAVGTPKIPNTTTFNAFDSLVAKVKQLGTTPVALPYIVTFDSVGGTTAASSYSVSRHPNAVVGDVQVEIFYTQPETRVWTMPGTGGWSQLANPSSGTSGLRMWYFARRDDGSSGPWTFTLDAAQTTGSRTRLLLRNIHATNILDPGATGTGISQTNNSFDANCTPGSITTSVNDVLEVYLQRTGSSVTFNPGPADVGYTIYSGFSSTTASVYHLATIARSTAGTFAGPTTTANASTTSSIVRLPFRGAGGGGATRTGSNARVYVRYTESS